MSQHVFALTDHAKVSDLMSKGGGPAVIDFWAGWCGPCRAMKPIYEAVAAQYEDTEVGFYSLDTEAHKDIVRSFRVRSLPTMVFIDDGKIVDVVIGRIDGKRLGRRQSTRERAASGASEDEVQPEESGTVDFADPRRRVAFYVRVCGQFAEACRRGDIHEVTRLTERIEVMAECEDLF